MLLDVSVFPAKKPGEAVWLGSEDRIPARPGLRRNHPIAPAKQNLLTNRQGATQQ